MLSILDEQDSARWPDRVAGDCADGRRLWCDPVPPLRRRGVAHERAVPRSRQPRPFRQRRRFRPQQARPPQLPSPWRRQCCDLPHLRQPEASGVIELDESRIGGHLDALQQIADDNNGTRAVGTSGYDASADYVEQQLTDMGYTVTRSEVDYTLFIELSPSTVTVGDQMWTSPEWIQPMIYSAPGDVTATPESVGIQNGLPTANGACTSDAWSAFHPGNIAIVMGGPCIRRDLVTLAVASGASAAHFARPTAGCQPDPPADAYRPVWHQHSGHRRRQRAICCATRGGR